MLDDILLIWSIRLSLICYVVSLALRMIDRAEAKRLIFNGVGWILLLIHVVAAYAHHDWSHLRAVEQTAVDTRETLGFAFGAGIYFNHLFLLVWLVDLIGEAAKFQFPKYVQIGTHSYLLVIAINGAIVFETGPTRWFGVVLIALLIAIAFTRKRIQPSLR